ncbi:MAG: hypothetical protein ABW250_04985 [Pyrinomonadaceae bacterium]
MRLKLGSILAALALAFACATRADAHDGPPYAILVDKSLGPSVASVWADPDVGTGTFFVILEPAPGAALPEEIKIDIAVRPLDNHAAEAVHAAAREAVRGRVQFKAEIPFDAEGRWRVRVLLQSPSGGGEMETDVEVTPPGLGRWDLLIYLFPFLLVGALWLRAVTRRRRPSV